MLPTFKRQNNWLPNLFSDFFNDEWLPMRALSSAAPAINVKENAKAFEIEIALPGMSKDDFRVHITDKDQLVISVEKKHENKEDEKSTKYLRKEFSYTRFEQSLMLPENVDRDGITAKACHGILRIELPKIEKVTEKEPARVIEIE
jgi:HSP20 family protein